MPEEQKSTTLLSRFKESFVAAREAIIVLVMLLILIQPSWIKSIAQDAGLKSAFGVEFSEEKLKESQAQTEAAQQEVDRIMNELTQVKGKLQELSALPAAARPEIKAKITDISNSVGTLQDKSKTVNNSLQANLKVQESILQVQKFQRQK